MDNEGQIQIGSDSEDRISLLRAQFDQDLKDKGVVVEEARVFPDVDVNFTAFGDNEDEEEARHAVDKIEEYLKQPYVTDNFGTEGHKERRVWRTEIQAKYSDTLGEEVKRVFHGSKYSGNGRNIIYTVLYGLTSWLSKVEKFADLYEKISAIKSQGPSFSDVDKIDINELKQRTEKFEDMLYEILKALGEYSHEQKSV